MQTKKLTFSFLFVILFQAPAAWGEVIQVTAPPDTKISGKKIQVVSLTPSGVHNLILPGSFIYPFTVTFKGPLGGFVERQIFSPFQWHDLSIKDGVIKSKPANPPNLALLPALCPRLKKMTYSNGHSSYFYDASKDKLNHVPSLQFFDPDVHEGIQEVTYSRMDGKNILLLKRVTIRYDYEDTAIIDYAGPNPLTGKDEIVYEGEGGFYANFHYALVPYDPKIKNMDRQTLLHLAEGKLKDIDRENLRPALRTHSFIPGPFLSKKQKYYEMCEWGDTAFQAPVQILEYNDMALWDWDYPVDSAGHILMIVWEGDEEDWLLSQKLIPPFYLTDDLVGIFEIKRKKTLKPLTLKNKKGDFEMTVETGDLQVKSF